MLWIVMDVQKKRAIPYKIAACDNPDIYVISYREIMKERYSNMNDDAEYLGTGGGFDKELLNFDGLQFHSSAVVVDGKVYLF